jgi:hypothetical protein
MDTQRREPSGINERAVHNDRLVYDNIGQTNTVQALLSELIEYHDNCFGGLESLLAFINEMLDNWVILTQNMVLIFRISCLSEEDPWKTDEPPPQSSISGPPQFSKPTTPNKPTPSNALSSSKKPTSSRRPTTSTRSSQPPPPPPRAPTAPPSCPTPPPDPPPPTSLPPPCPPPWVPSAVVSGVEFHQLAPAPT